MAIRRTLTAFAVASAATLTLVSVPAHADDTDVQSSSARTPATVSVPVRSINTPGHTGQNGLISVKVGNAPAFTVLVDTGSVGLRLWGRRPDVAKLTDEIKTEAAGGTKFTGPIALATVSIGGVSTVHPVPVQLVNTDNPYINVLRRRGVTGIIGLGTGTGTLTNPIMSFPGALGLRWSVHFERTVANSRQRTGEIILGAEAAPDADMSFKLASEGVNEFGAHLWNDHQAAGCWTFGNRPTACVPTRFDSGATEIRVKGSEFKGLPTDTSGDLRTGTHVSFGSATSAFAAHHFVAGGQASRNQVKVLPHGSSAINTGNFIYYDYTVSYDTVTGVVTMSKSSTGKAAR